MKHNDHLEEALGRTKKTEAPQRMAKDCPFWMEGFCNYSKEDCNKGRHRREKFNTRQKRGVLSEEKIVNNVLEVLSKQQRPQGMTQQQMMLPQQQPMLQQQMMPSQQPMMAMQPQQMGPLFQQQLGFRQDTSGRQWNNGFQQDLLDMSSAGCSGTTNLRFTQ